MVTLQITLASELTPTAALGEEIMNARARISAIFAARDPGRTRLTNATAIALGVLASALISSLVLNMLHGDKALLAMAVFLSVQAGSMVKDATAAGRAVTTAILIPSVVLAICVATLLSSHRPVVIAVFIVMTGVAIWARKFGARAAAMGSLSFMGFFFTLFMQPTMKELPAFCLVAAIAVTTQLVARLVLLLKRPKRELKALLLELRLASGTALRAAKRPEHAAKLRAALARIDEIGRTLSSWQQEFRTDQVVDCDEQTFGERVLDARVETEEACFALRRALSSGSHEWTPALEQAYANFTTVLDEHATNERRTSATDWAERILSEADQRGVDSLVEYQLARATFAHTEIRKIELRSGRARNPHATLPASPAAHRPAAPAAKPHPLRWKPWSDWAPTSRMALQAMVAASLASGVGEAISASRWYWAVITVFVIFVGATTRSGILTKAYRRVLGTAIGICVGVALVSLAGHDSGVLVVICVVSVFGMLYLGPLNYLYSSLCITIMLVSLYRMLGVLDQSILELRLVETLSGAVIGVLCAYLILTTNSRPVLVVKVDAYFDAIDRLLRSVSTTFESPAARTEVATDLHSLETHQVDLEKTVASMSTAFLVGSPHYESDAVHLMYIATRSAARLTQATGEQAHHSTIPALAPSDRQPVSDAITEVLESSARARQALCSPNNGPGPQHGSSTVLSVLDHLPADSHTSNTAAIIALARINWAFTQVVGHGRAR